jgi:hypothetical protein
MEMQVVKRTTENNTEHQPFLPYLLLFHLLIITLDNFLITPGVPPGYIGGSGGSFHRMNYDNFTVIALRARCSARGLPTSGLRKPALVAALIAADMSAPGAMPGLQWVHLAEAALDATIARFNLHYTGVADHPSKQQWLSDLGFTPTQCLPLQTPAAAPRGPRLDLARQGDEEPIDLFLERTQAVLANSSADSATLIATLLNASRPVLAEAIVAWRVSMTPQATLGELLSHLKLIFKQPLSACLMAFNTAKPGPGESYALFGRRLRNLYVKCLEPTPGGNFDASIRPALLSRLLFSLSPSQRAPFLLVLDREPDLPWMDLCLRADTCGGLQSAPPGQSAARSTTRGGGSSRSGTTRTPDRPWFQCAHHGRARHSTEECSLTTGKPPPLRARTNAVSEDNPTGLPTNGLAGNEWRPQEGPSLWSPR